MMPVSKCKHGIYLDGCKECFPVPEIQADSNVYNLFKTVEPTIPDDIWECNCGCHLFYINPEGCTCSGCGEYQIFKD
jgi:hypothetical protein